MTTRAPNICLACTHFHTKVYNGPAYCSAFPDGGGIPVEIWSGRNDHSRHFAGDHGVRFELQPGFEHTEQAYRAFQDLGW